MKNLLCLLTLLSWIGASAQNSDICNLTGTLINCKDSTKLYLVNLDAPYTVDSITVISGTFRFQLQLKHPSKFVLHNERDQYEFRDRKYLWLEPSEIKLNGNYEFLKNLHMEGSASNMVFEKYNQMLDAANKKINLLEEQIHFKSDAEKISDQKTIDSLKNKLSNDIVEFMIAHKNSYVTLFELHSECLFAFRHLDKMQVEKIYKNLSPEFQNTEKGIEIKKYIELPDPPKIGELAPEIIQVTLAGDTVHLSDLRGKYVLLDFWSSSCAPCRGQFKWLRKIYKEYHSQGFEILSVSGDTKKQNWVAAMQHDSIPWVNVSDLNGWKNEAFLRYDIKYIPQKFLISPEGIIIKDEKKIGCEPVLRNILAEIFDQNNGLQ